MPVLTKIATGAAQAAGSPFNGSWTNESLARVASSDATAAGSNTYATCAPGKNQEFASVWPFDFSDVGTTDTVNSVSVKVQWKVSTTSSVAELRSSMFADQAQATAVSAVPGVSDTAEPTSDTDRTYSATPTAAQLNAGVWVRVQALRGSSNTSVTFSLDYIQVTVDYTADSSSPQTVAVTGRTSSGSYGASSVAVGGVTVQVSGQSSTGSYGAVTPSPGGVFVAVAGLTSQGSYGVVSTDGTQIVDVSGLSSSSSYGAVQPLPGGIAATVSGFSSSSLFGTTVVLVGGVTVSVAGRTSSSSFGAIVQPGNGNGSKPHQRSSVSLTIGIG